MFHRTRRMLMRPPWPEDSRALHAGIADEAIVRNLATAPWPYLHEHAREFLQLPVEPGLPRFLLFEPNASGTRLVGSVGLGEHEGDVELGYWIARAHWGHGFATEAVLALLQIARTLGHTRLIASHFGDNPASGAVLRKAGFKPTGTSSMRYSKARGAEADGRDFTIDLTRTDIFCCESERRAA
ncbi:hypothetical protein HME9302_01622 [Alteripontixanthobacter maritimus]|uniref:N-acetyltransferase domain-containing protein n=1 Tax=Alteripontixanthobacter maritimus TaxID=2161824 RepID=A0A369QA38_9SPHN|nr:GNAT family N-acetyltransferase [Alteripontixanthobacter maritimus]RDC60415.1 hypothetical protein HME9302_01622 [Alteripontixanthobacter maritimus]